MIPPGGEGKITLKVNLAGYQGRVSKGATVTSDDPKRPKIRLKLTAKVIPYISVKPSNVVFFRGPAKKLQPRTVELQTTKQTWHVTKIESTLEGKVSYKLETVQEGKRYRLVLTNQVAQGNYAGVITCRTDHPKKPVLRIKVRGMVEGPIGVRPTTLVIGKLNPKAPPRPGRVLVVSNEKTPFKIVRLEYDASVLTVTQKPLPKERPGYVLEIRPNLSAVKRGSQKRVRLVVETDAEPGLVHPVNVIILHR